MVDQAKMGATIEEASANSRVDVVANAIAELIFTGELLPGSPIREAAMAQRLDVSRGPVREACRSLAATGLVSIAPGRGAYVRVLSLKEIVNIFDVRAALGRLAGEQAASAIVRSELADLATLIERMDEMARADDSRGYTELNLRFHDVLYRASRNDRLVELDRSMGNELRVFRQEGVAFGGLAVSNREHRDLLHCLERGDAAAAGQKLAQHISNGRDRFIRARTADGSVRLSRMEDQ